MIFSIRSLSFGMVRHRLDKSKNILVGGLAGLGLLVGLIGDAGAASPLPEQFIPPQQSIPMPLETKQVFAADVNGDGCADLVSLVWQTPRILLDGKYTQQVYPVIEIRKNKCIDKKAAEALEFMPAEELDVGTGAAVRVILDEADAAHNDAVFNNSSWLNSINITTLTVEDLDQDGLPDLIVTSAKTARVTIFWNQGKTPANGRHFVYDSSDFKKTVILGGSTVFPQTSYVQSSSGGIPLCTAVADVNGDGKYDLISYWVNYDRYDPKVTPQQFEAIGVVLGTPSFGGHIGFDPVQRRLSGADLKIGNNPTKDLFPKGTKLFNYLPWGNNGVGERLYSRQTDDLGTANYGMYQQLVCPLKVDHASEKDDSDAVWFLAHDQSYKLVWDGDQKLMVRQSPLSTTINPREPLGGKQHGGAIAFIPSPTGGKSALIAGGGMRVHYPPIDKTNRVDLPADLPPSYYSFDWQFGSWLDVQQMGTGQALLTLGYHLQPGEGEGTSNNSLDDKNFDYIRFSIGQTWGYPASLFVEYAETDGSRYKSFLSGIDRSRIQVIPTMTSMLHLPQIVVGSFVPKSEKAIGILADGHFDIFRPNTDKSYTAPKISVDGIIPDSLEWLDATDAIKKVAPGTNIMLIGDLGVSAWGVHNDPVSDPPRYTIIKRKSDGAIIRVLPIAQVTKSTDDKKYIAHVERIKDLPADTYTFEIWNSGTSASTDITVETSFSIASSNLDFRMSDACGIQKSSFSGVMYPGELRLTVANLPAGTLDKVRFQRLSDGKLWEVAAGASGATMSGSEVVLSIPGDIESGTYRIAIKANGYWQEHARRMKVNRDGTGCDQVVNLRDPTDPNKRLNWINHTSLAQNDDITLYLQKIDNIPDPSDATGKTAMTVLAGDMYFVGTGFAAWQVQSALLKQGTTEIWYDLVLDPKNPNDNWISVKWGDLSDLTDGQPVDVYFYPETHANVVAKGARPVGKITNWRTAKAGTWKAPPDSDMKMTSSRKIDGIDFVGAGTTLTMVGSGLVFPGPNNMRPAFSLDDDIYLYPFGAAAPTTKWFTEKQSNAKAELQLDIGPDPSLFLLSKADAKDEDTPVIETGNPLSEFIKVNAKGIADHVTKPVLDIAKTPGGTAVVGVALLSMLRRVGPAAAFTLVMGALYQNDTPIVAAPKLALGPKRKEPEPDDHKDLYIIEYVVNGPPGPLPDDDPDLDDGRDDYSYDRVMHFAAVCARERNEFLSVARKAMAIAIRGGLSEVALTPGDYNIESGNIRAVMVGDYVYKSDTTPCKPGDGKGQIVSYSRWKVRGYSILFPTFWDQTVFEGTNPTGLAAVYSAWSIKWRLRMAGIFKRFNEKNLEITQIFHTVGLFARVLGKESDFTWVQPDTPVHP